MGPDRREQTEPVRTVDLDAVSNDTPHFCAPAQLFVVVVVVMYLVKSYLTFTFLCNVNIYGELLKCTIIMFPFFLPSFLPSSLLSFLYPLYVFFYLIYFLLKDNCFTD